MTNSAAGHDCWRLRLFAVWHSSQLTPTKIRVFVYTKIAPLIINSLRLYWKEPWAGNKGYRLRGSLDSRISFGMSTGRGSAGNVIASLCSFFFPGLGQLTQGRVFSAIIFFLGAAVVWFISFGTMGWIIHVWACIDAALWRGKGTA